MRVRQGAHAARGARRGCTRRGRHGISGAMAGRDRADKNLNSVGQDWAVIGLVSTAHACSHFYQLVLPPLFPLLMTEFGIGYTEVGLLVTVFYSASGLLQAPAGFIVDRIGASKVLIAGTLLGAGAVALMGLAPSYLTLL